MKYKTGETAETDCRLIGHYRPLSDTALIWAEFAIGGNWTVFDVNRKLKVDADTLVEVGGSSFKLVVACQAMHASYLRDGRPLGLPRVYVDEVERMVDGWKVRSADHRPSLATVQTCSYVSRFELELGAVDLASRQTRAVTKSVEAALAEMVENLYEREKNGRLASDPGFAAMHELIASVADSDGLSCYRTAVAAMNAMADSDCSDKSTEVMLKVARLLCFTATWEQAAEVARSVEL